jgi:hypothetical protein
MINSNPLIGLVTYTADGYMSGTDIERHFQAQDDRLLLRTPSMSIGGVQAMSVGMWQRVHARMICALQPATVQCARMRVRDELNETLRCR